MSDIGVFAYLRGLNFENNEELGKIAIYGQALVRRSAFAHSRKSQS